MEVGHLEQYLLSLYRKAFDQQISSLSPSAQDERIRSPLTTPRRRRLEFSRSDVTLERANLLGQDSQFVANPRKETTGVGEEKLVETSVHRCHSSLSQCSAMSNKTSIPAEPLGKALRACHSQPLSIMEVSCNFQAFCQARGGLWGGGEKG